MEKQVNGERTEFSKKINGFCEGLISETSDRKSQTVIVLALDKSAPEAAGLTVFLSGIGKNLLELLMRSMEKSDDFKKFTEEALKGVSLFGFLKKMSESIGK